MTPAPRRLAHPHGPTSGAHRSLRALGALAAACVMLLAAAGQAAAAPPHHFVGLQNWDDPGTTIVNRMKRANVHSWRLNLNWSSAEPTRGEWTWRRYDPVYLRAAQAGVRIVPVFLASPRWVCNPSCSRHNPQYPPRSAVARNHFDAFVLRAVRRYGPNGYFWKGTGIPQSSRPKWFQVWNEPNLPNYWNNHADAAAYGRFLKRTSQKVREADPDAKVLAAGLPHSSTKAGVIGMPTFLRRMLAEPGVSDAVDAVAVHPYTKEVSGLFSFLDQARRALRASPGGSTKSLFITEFAWATGGNAGISVSRATQAARLRSAYRQLIERRESYRLEGAYWFTYRDRQPKPHLYNWWGWYSGLFDLRGRPKPSWTEFVRVAGGAP
jgi:polysaccharide biosynthesis protein PslG